MRHQSGRQLTWWRKFMYRVATPIAKGLIRAVWGLCASPLVHGDATLQQLLAQRKPVIIVFWHRHQIFCIHYLLRLRSVGLVPGFLISPSVDGEIAANIARSWGSEVVRASATRSGAKAIREIFLLMQKGVSPVANPDGPSGPIFAFKPGSIMLAKMTHTPIVPITYAASRFWRTPTWDQFIIPKPFSRICVQVGEPVDFSGQLDAQTLENEQALMQALMKQLYLQAKARLPES